MIINKLIDLYEIFGFKIEGFGAENYITFRKLCALKVTGTRFYVSGHEARTYSGGPGFFYKGVFKQIFVAKMKKTLVAMSQKLLYRLCIC